MQYENHVLYVKHLSGKQIKQTSKAEHYQDIIKCLLQECFVFHKI